MKYISTRDSQARPTRFSDTLLAGLAPDGGLYLPESYPQADDEVLSRWRSLLEVSYASLAGDVVARFVDDIPIADLQSMCDRAYCTPVFSDPRIVPVEPLTNGLYLGRLSMGPTAAFKDMAMQLLGELFEHQLRATGRVLNIVGATSGDTGSSAEYAMRGRDGIKVFMLTPRGRMTPFQQAQMFGLHDDNIVNIAVDGVFDDCQDIVKAISTDADFKATRSIGAVNSINWARLMAQVIYYIACWARVTTNNDQKVSFCVPSGNFGNICAGHIARSMGLPIDRLILATNENNVLEEFFRTGDYRVRTSAETFATSSPSMDISKASNFERFIFDLLGRDATRIQDLFGNQVPRGGFSLADDDAFARIASEYGFVSGTSTHADRLETIARVKRETGIVIDPHTADGVKVATDLRDEVDTPIVCLETALPVKFAHTIREATGEDLEVPERFKGIEDVPFHVVEMPNDPKRVMSLIDEKLQTSR